MKYVIQENTHHNLFFHFSSDTKTDAIDITFVVERNAYVRAEFLVAHTSCQLSVTCIMQGQGSQAIITGAYILRDDNRVSIDTRQQHDSHHATSKVTLKGILYDNSFASYTGMIFVPKESHSTVASQENKNILIGNAARAVSVPQLEVSTNDVHCFHGSATGRLDQEHLFYAATRGINKHDAQRLLLQGFLANVFESDQAKISLERYI